MNNERPRIEPFPIPRVTITRIAWSPFQAQRWHVSVERGPVTFATTTRWRVEAARWAVGALWGGKP